MACSAMDRSLWASTSIPKRPKPPAQSPKISRSNRKYRNMKIRSHDDMLQQQYEELRLLLDDQRYCSGEDLHHEQLVQTEKLLESYKSLNRGRTKGLLISRSLPGFIRSPRSAPASRSGSPRVDRKQSMRPKSAAHKRPISPKRVTFKSRQTRCVASESDESASERDETQSDQTQSSSEGETEYDKEIPESKEQVTNHKKEGHEETETPRSIEEEIISRSEASLGVQAVHQYVKERRQRKKEKQYRAETPDESTKTTTEIQQEVRKYGVIQDESGVKHSDCNLRTTDNKMIKQWLRDKNKLLCAQKRQKKKELKREKEEEEKKEEEKAKRHELSLKKLREWNAAKRKEAKLLKREKQEVFHLTMASKFRSKQSDRPQEEKKAPKQRPKSAPAPKTASPRPSEITTQILIDNNPDLKEKLKELERQKKLKHRQSYEDWCKVKAREKRDTLKAVREQRIKLEKEISEESTRLISEAARRRLDGMKFKPSQTEGIKEKVQEETEAKSTAFPTPCSWRLGGGDSKEPANHEGATSRPKLSKTTAMPKAGKTENSKRKTNVEDNIVNETENPFTDPFKPPKLHRPKSKLEQSGINGAEFSRFIWNMVNEEAGSTRPEPQGADSSSTSTKPTKMKPPPSPTYPNPKPGPDAIRRERNENISPPRPSKSPIPPKKQQADGEERSEPVIENGNRIFSMTSIE